MMSATESLYDMLLSEKVVNKKEMDPIEARAMADFEQAKKAAAPQPTAKLSPSKKTEAVPMDVEPPKRDEEEKKPAAKPKKKPEETKESGSRKKEAADDGEGEVKKTKKKAPQTKRKREEEGSDCEDKKRQKTKKDEDDERTQKKKKKTKRTPSTEEKKGSADKSKKKKKKPADEEVDSEDEDGSAIKKEPSSSSQSKKPSGYGLLCVERNRIRSALESLRAKNARRIEQTVSKRPTPTPCCLLTDALEEFWMNASDTFERRFAKYIDIDH